MTASYSTSSSGVAASPAMLHTPHHQASHQATPRYAGEASSSYQTNGYGLDPVQQYARILYEHTRQQLDNASSAASSQQSHREARQSHRNHRSRNGDGRTAAFA